MSRVSGTNAVGDGNETNNSASVSDGSDANDSAAVSTETHDPIPVSTETHEPHIEVLKGNPTDEELAALTAVLGSVGGGPGEPAQPERNRWGMPVDKLRYPVFSWQRITLQERMHMRR